VPIVGVADEVIDAISIDDPETRTFFQLAIVYVNYKYLHSKKEIP
jgi:hypothetical protein